MRWIVWIWWDIILRGWLNVWDSVNWRDILYLIELIKLLLKHRLINLFIFKIKLYLKSICLLIHLIYLLGHYSRRNYLDSLHLYVSTLIIVSSLRCLSIRASSKRSRCVCVSSKRREYSCWERIRVGFKRLRIYSQISLRNCVRKI